MNFAGKGPGAASLPLLSLLAALLAAGCGSRPSVVRVAEGRVLEGRFVEPDAYAAFLRGALDEERGDLAAARRAYEVALELDPHDPEVWTRIAAVRCRTNPADPQARRAAAEALERDPNYAAAWEVRAACGLGGAAAATDDARRAAELDPRRVDYQVLLARQLAGRGTRADRDLLRQRLFALTSAHPTSSAAWGALAVWARGRGDGFLAARAWSRVAALAPAQRELLAGEAVALAGEGEAVGAALLAGAVVDARRDGRHDDGRTRGPWAMPQIAVLAVDDALARGDLDGARRRATHTHFGAARLAARALLLGQRDVAATLARALVDAEPAAVDARLVLALIAHEAHDLTALRAALAPGIPRDPLAAETYLLLVQAAAASVDGARAIAADVAHDPITPGDERLGRLAVDLAARELIDVALLPPAARVELALRRGEAPAVAPEALDPRHRLLVGHDPALAVRLAGRVGTDPLVTLALAPSPPSRLAALAPADPLVIAAALEVARRAGETELAERLRAQLAPLAVTAREKQLAAAR